MGPLALEDTARAFLAVGGAPELAIGTLTTLETTLRDAERSDTRAHSHHVTFLGVVAEQPEQARVRFELTCRKGAASADSRGELVMRAVDDGWRVEDIVTREGSAVERSFPLALDGAPPWVEIRGHIRATSQGGLVAVALENRGETPVRLTLRLGPAWWRRRAVVGPASTGGIVVFIPNLSWFRRLGVGLDRPGESMRLVAAIPSAAREQLPSPLRTLRHPLIAVRFAGLALSLAALALVFAGRMLPGLACLGASFVLSGCVTGVARRLSRTTPS